MRLRVRQELGICRRTPGSCWAVGRSICGKGPTCSSTWPGWFCPIPWRRVLRGEPGSSGSAIALTTLPALAAPRRRDRRARRPDSLHRAAADTAPYFLAADVFALTSREDPCPLVNFEAMESGLAVVAFQGAGGAPEVLGDGGVCVPYIDVDAMARADARAPGRSRARDEMGRRGQTLIRDRFTWARFMDEFLDILKTDFQYRPAQRLKVSVIVPNYRHARYLEERLRSIFDQTLRPHEIIFLDDASPDESVEVARRLAASSPVPMRIVVNEQNSGSTFRQWLKGLSLATGDLIWFAESDDSAHPLFLERLVPEFYDPEVTLAYCQSAIDRAATARRWRTTFSATPMIFPPPAGAAVIPSRGVEEAELALSQKNTIPNASAVVFRRPGTARFRGRARQTPVRRRLVLLRHADPGR